MSTKNRLLLIDPDESWCIEAQRSLEKHNFIVDMVHNGKDAQRELYLQKYMAVVLNVNVENYSGEQVLKYIQSKFTQLPVYLIAQDNTNVPELLQGHGPLAKLGESAILKKHFPMDKLRNLVEGRGQFKQVLQQESTRASASEELAVDGGDEEFSAIGINEFLSTKKVLFDVFVRLGAGKFVRIFNEGDPLENERILNYRDQKGLQHLYIRTIDRQRFIQLGNAMVETLVNNENVDSKVKIKALKTTAEKIIEDFQVEGIRPQMIEEGLALCNSMYKMFSSDPKLFKTLNEFYEFDYTHQAHSFLVCFYSGLMAKQFSWESKATIKIVGIASMLHDVGLMKLPENLRCKAAQGMSPEEFHIFKKHPIFSVETLYSARAIPEAALQIVLQHHERQDGSGHPYGLKGKKVSTLAKIIQLADEFVDVLMLERKKPMDILKTFLLTPEYRLNFDAEILENFTRAFIDPEKLKEIDEDSTKPSVG